MDLISFSWLLTDPGQRLLDVAAGLVDDDPLAAQTALRGSATAEQAAAALTQARLRSRAVEKFGDEAALMYFTPDGLEQATRRAVADHRAGRLVAFEAASVIDLGCGIGGDLIAAARAQITAAGVDLDPVTAAVAEANLAALGLAGAVKVADATEVDTAGFAVAFADPARRSSRGRAFKVEDWSPPWPFVQGLLTRDSCVKVAPGIDHDLIPDGVEAEWVSDRGDLKEAALWSGNLATVRRRATVIAPPGHSGGLATITDEEDPGAEVRGLGDYLYEPDDAVIRAGLVTAVAAGVGGGLIDEHIAYVTADAAFHTPFARSYRVLEVLPYRERALRAALRTRGIGELTIKKRGVQIVPETLRRSLALSGPNRATIVMTRIADQGTCVLVEPI